MGLMLGLGLTFGALGAGFSIFQGWNRAQEEQEEIRRRKEEERRMREAQIAEQRAAAEREINYAKSVFKIEQEDAFRKADDIWHQGERIDMRADLDETLTGRAFNLAIKQNNAQDENLLHQEQRGKQNFQNTQGSFKAALGTSGVRAGANSSEALLSQNEENFNQDLALMKTQRETQKEISLMSAFSSLKGGMFRIDEERDAANKAFRDSKQLRDDYTGDVFNENINAKIKALEDEYDNKIHNVKPGHIGIGVGFGGLANMITEKIRLEQEKKLKIKELKDSYEASVNTGTGGRAVNLFNQKIANRRLDLQGNIDLQNLGGFFKQQAMQRAYDRAEYSFLDGLTDLFGGFGSGWNFGTSIAGFANKWGGGSFGGGAGSFGGTAAALSNYQRKHRSPYMNMLK